MLRFTRHSSQLDEAFNKPYRYALKKINSNYYSAKFDLADGGEIYVMFEGMEWSDTERAWHVKFQRANPKRPHQEMGITGEGDAMRIFGTVIAVIQEFVKKEKPLELGFAAHKPDWMMPDQPKRSELTSRERLYKTLVKRYAPRMGYKYSTRTDDMSTDFTLVKK